MKFVQNIVPSQNYIQSENATSIQLLLVCLDEIFLVEITREWEEDNALIHYLSFTKQTF